MEAERKNITIMEVLKSMIHDHDLPMHLWAKATRTTMYVQNIMSLGALGNKTIEEMLTIKKTEVRYLKIFGCPIFIRVPKEKRSKLDPSRKKGIFVGYSDHSKAYRVYILSYRQINISRDVIFDEDTTFSKSRKNHVEENKEE